MRFTPLSQLNNNQEPILLLVDNGSTRVDAAVQLRRIAQSLTAKAGKTVHAVSMQHSNNISEDDVNSKLAGKPAQVFRDFMRDKLAENHRDFILIPLFFGKSRAITSFVPTQIELLTEEFGDIRLTICDVIYPLPDGDPRLIEILYQHALSTTEKQKPEALKNLVLVDHGSPLPAVNEVRQHITSALNQKLPKDIKLNQAAMERRKGKAYDFNGELLEDYLNKLGKVGETQVSVLLLFLLPGTHAGENGDIVKICNQAMETHPDLNVTMSPLIGDNPLLIDCLDDRLKKGLAKHYRSI